MFLDRSGEHSSPVDGVVGRVQCTAHMRRRDVVTHRLDDGGQRRRQHSDERTDTECRRAPLT